MMALNRQQFQLWNTAQIQTTNLIKCGLFDAASNKTLTKKALDLFTKFATVGTTTISLDDDNSIHDYTDRIRRKRKRPSFKSSSTSQSLSLNYNVDSKTGVTTNDRFFEHQKNNGYCQQLMPISEFSQLQNILTTEVQTYLSSFTNSTTSSELIHRLNIDSTVKLDVWATVQIGKEAYHANHVHENVFVSGVYYASVPDGSAPFVLYKPMDKDRDVEIYRQNDDHDATFVIHPEEGQVVIFPPWLLHGVPRPTKLCNELPRVSFAFNVSGFSLGDHWDATKLELR